MTGSPEPLFAKSYFKSSPNVRKRWVKSEFSIKKFFPQSNLLFTWNSVLKKLPKASRWKSYKIFAQNPRIKTKDWFFKRDSPKTFFWTRRLRISNLPEVTQPNWKKEYSSFSCFLSEYSPRHRGSRFDKSAQCSLLKVQT